MASTAATVFRYQARQPNGSSVEGTVSAANRDEAIASLRSQSLFPVKVEATRGAMATMRPKGRKRVKVRDLVRFFSQMSDLLHSGVPLLRALSIMQRQSSNKTLSEVIGETHRKVSDGKSLADAMQDEEKVFGELAISMVRAGQEGGFLEEVFKRIALFTERQEDLKGKVMGALAYPLVLMGMGTVILTVLVVYFVPQFDVLFTQLREKGELPALTHYLLELSKFLKSYGIVVLIALVAGIWYFRRWLETTSGRRVLDTWKMKTPILGPIFRDLAITRFNRVLGTLRKNGIPILQALKIAKGSTGNVLMIEAIEKAAENVKSGDKLATPLRASGVFPTDIVEMIEVAEESNSLETVLIDSADSLETRTTRQLDLAVRFFEPALLLVMAFLVLLVVLALLLPIFKMNNALS